MTGEQLNELYADYCLNPDKYLNSLLDEVRRRAANSLKDDDAAQECTLAVWTALSTANVANFTAWLHLHIKWERGRMYRRRDEGRTTTYSEEDLDYLTWIQTSKEYKEVSVPQIPAENKFIRDVAHLLLEGYTQEQTAKHLGTTPDGLRKSLQRFRKKNSL